MHAGGGHPVLTSRSGRPWNSRIWTRRCVVTDDAGPTVPAGGSDPPDRFGSYAILSELGHGGMGVVYRARKDGTSVDVALKVIQISRMRPEDLARFRRECATLSDLHHAGV